VRLRNLIALDVVLFAACVPGIFNVLAKDHVSRVEGVIAWVSAAGLILSVLGLLVLLALGVRRFVRPS
jgi:hypothetical protein